MKKLTMPIVLCLWFVSTVMGAAFQPSMLKFSVPTSLHYNFDGTPLMIPFKVSGSSGTLVFGIFTRDMANTIGPVRNGYLGWHYVNKVDTCIYISEQIQFTVGNNMLSWDGKDSDRIPVPAGAYTYHMFAVDTVNQPQKCIPNINKDYNGAGFIEEYQADGTPYPMPVWTNYPDAVDIDRVTYKLRKKWVIGSDPDDSGLMESTYYKSNQADIHYIAWAPESHDFFFQGGYSGLTTGILRKWRWVANGEAVLDTSWGVNGAFEYAVNEQDATWTVDTDGDSYLFALNQGYHKTKPYSELIVIDAEKAAEVKRLDLREFYVKPEDALRGGWINGGPTKTMFRNGYLFTNCHHSCTHLMIDPYEEDDGEFVRWANQNGDYVLDHDFTEDSARPWVCNEPKVQQIIVDYEADDNLWTVAPIYDTGGAIVTFGLLAPDGTGVGNFTIAGENGGRKLGGMIIDSGSAYDGICFSPSEIDFKFTGDLYWIGHDSISGVISWDLEVETIAPSRFTVTQNTPNPFNPITTIAFTMAESAQVTVEIFNTAGQKINTIAEGFMEAGSHSVVWDGSTFAAGIYFYRVKSGTFSQTMKMTLLK